MWEMVRRLAVAAVCCMPAKSAPVCATCHPKETARFAGSAMGRSAGAVHELPGGHFSDVTSGAEIIVEMRGGRLIQQMSERGLTATYPMAFEIGSGLKGRTFAVAVGDYLLESPASWYRDRGWDLSPGYERQQLIDFDRPVTAACLFCHAGSAKFSDSDKRRVELKSVTAITCERCHGMSEEHLQRPSAKNIVNPAKLGGAARSSVCEQCHLEGETRVVNPGKSLEDFRAGETLENTIVPYLFQQPSQERPAVSQFEELARSQCARGSGGKLWCGTCHDPHGEKADRTAQVRAVCSGCHASLSKPAHSEVQQDCVACHMPRRGTTNIAHVSITDHRIQRPGERFSEEASSAATIHAWRAPPEQFAQRDLALAELQIGAERQLPDLIRRGTRRLETLPGEAQSKDAGALAVLESIFLHSSDPKKAAALGQWAVESEPKSATFALNLGIAMRREGKVAEAEHELLRAIDLDPSMMQAYAELAVIYDGEHRADDAKKIIRRFLEWNPQNVQFRLALRP